MKKNGSLYSKYLSVKNTTLTEDRTEINIYKWYLNWCRTLKKFLKYYIIPDVTTLNITKIVRMLF